MSGMIKGKDYEVCNECGCEYTLDRIGRAEHEETHKCDFKCSGKPKCTLNGDYKCDIHG